MDLGFNFRQIRGGHPTGYPGGAPPRKQRFLNPKSSWRWARARSLRNMAAAHYLSLRPTAARRAGQEILPTTFRQKNTRNGSPKLDPAVHGRNQAATTGNAGRRQIDWQIFPGRPSFRASRPRVQISGPKGTLYPWGPKRLSPSLIRHGDSRVKRQYLGIFALIRPPGGRRVRERQP